MSLLQMSFLGTVIILLIVVLIFSNSNGTMYIEVTRDKSGKISSFQKVSKNRMQELFAEFNPETETFAEYNSEAKH